MAAGHNTNGSSHPPRGSHGLEELRVLAAKLGRLDGIDGVYLGRGDASHLTVYVVAREHGLVDRDALFQFEDEAAAALHRSVDVRVQAHQGRGPQALADGYELLFARG